MEDLKIRCSALGKIMHFDPDTTITEIQNTELNRLLAKESLTPPQTKTMNKYLKKRDAPLDISKGAKTYIQDVFFGKKFDYQKNFTSKYTQKGNEVEDPAIKQIVDYLGLPMVFKNEERFENDYIHGTPDVVLKALNFQFDNKAPYYPNGLDSFEEKTDHDYEWQGHGYDWLTEVDNGMVIKILMNPPEDILLKEARTLWVDAGNKWSDPINDNFMAEVRDYFNFERVPVADRINIKRFVTTDKEIQAAKDAVILSRVEYAKLEELWKMKNTEELNFIKSLIKTSK